MISAIIFAAHLFFIIIIFVKKWQDDSLGSAFLNLALIIILFTVGWSITSSVVFLFTDSKGLGFYYPADAISLTFLSIAEFFFYRIYYYKDEKPTEAGKETQ